MKASPENLLSELLRRVEQLEARVYQRGMDAPPSPPPKPKMGRKPKLEKSELLERRRSVTNWLEQSWPILSVPLRKARDSDEALQAIVFARGSGTYPFQPPFYRRAEEFKEELWAFLKSGKFRGNPRNLANAIAGLPELSWKRSFDICSSNPDKTGLLLEAYWDYMRRKFPDRLRELSEVTTPEQVTLVLSRSRTTDPVYIHLKQNPKKALEWLNSGKPRSGVAG